VAAPPSRFDGRSAVLILDVWILPMKTIIDLTGKRFGRLVVIEPVPRKPGRKGGKWNCRCDCGTQKVFSGSKLQIGYRSCGCLFREKIDDAHRRLLATNGESSGGMVTPEYRG
jgi:hypothetical protein